MVGIQEDTLSCLFRRLNSREMEIIEYLDEDITEKPRSIIILFCQFIGMRLSLTEDGLLGIRQTHFFILFCLWQLT